MESTHAISRKANAGTVSLPRSKAKRTDGDWTSSRSRKTVRGRAIFVVPERSYRCGVGLINAADHHAIGKHVVVIIVPFRLNVRKQPTLIRKYPPHASLR